MIALARAALLSLFRVEYLLDKREKNQLVKEQVHTFEVTKNIFCCLSYVRILYPVIHNARIRFGGLSD